MSDPHLEARVQQLEHEVHALWRRVQPPRPHNHVIAMPAWGQTHLPQSRPMAMPELVQVPPPRTTPPPRTHRNRGQRDAIVMMRVVPTLTPDP